MNIKRQLTETARSALEAREQVPNAPATGMRPEHQALLDRMFAQTRETLLGVAEAAHEGLAGLASGSIQTNDEEQNP